MNLTVTPYNAAPNFGATYRTSKGARAVARATIEAISSKNANKYTQFVADVNDLENYGKDLNFINIAITGFDNGRIEYSSTAKIALNGRLKAEQIDRLVTFKDSRFLCSRIFNYLANNTEEAGKIKNFKDAKTNLQKLKYVAGLIEDEMSKRMKTSKNNIY